MYVQFKEYQVSTLVKKPQINKVTNKAFYGSFNT